MAASPRIPRRSLSSRSGSEWTVAEVHETGSTNADLLALVGTDDAVDRLVLRTEHQTAGRGRLDRRWEAPRGSNLLVSILFLRPPEPAHLSTQAVGLAAVRAVDRCLSPGRAHVASLKWPNDVLLDGHKLAGVLAQRHELGPVVVGIGLNVGWAPEGASRLADVVDDPPSPGALLEILIDELDAVLSTSGTRSVDGAVDPGEVTASVRERMSTLGSQVRVELPGGDVVIGEAVGLDETGALLVEAQTASAGPTGASGPHVERFDVGDVVHLRPSGH